MFLPADNEQIRKPPVFFERMSDHTAPDVRSFLVKFLNNIRYCKFNNTRVAQGIRCEYSTQIPDQQLYTELNQDEHTVLTKQRKCEVVFSKQRV